MEHHDFEQPAQAGDNIRSRCDDGHGATKAEIESAHQQMSPPSNDWTKLSNILRRSCGGSSRKRAHRL
ncbi:Hypothetical protein BIBO2_2068 [Brucella sp. BO2]|uniref:Uncharacterized protein n=1 Tax=Brucella ovis (strain ATCC 25840 / 63/290 / NCTC 10512) TaxID=444178 RepID=A0A0H3AM18_BRUO2|nr:hypothetical protein BOV_0431 [Brucella ovis ATCC 25840]EFM59051.1 Hypothetical protein BIBO2_2068 [Brucella sp. BO2]